MCLCDDKYYKVTNVRTGEVKCYKRAASISRRFEVNNHWIPNCLISDNLLLHLKGERYRVGVNKHPECQQLRRKIKEHFSLYPSYLTSKSIEEFKRKIEEKELRLLSVAKLT